MNYLEFWSSGKRTSFKFYQYFFLFNLISLFWLPRILDGCRSSQIFVRTPQPHLLFYLWKHTWVVENLIGLYRQLQLVLRWILTRPIYASRWGLALFINQNNFNADHQISHTLESYSLIYPNYPPRVGPQWGIKVLQTYRKTAFKQQGHD